MNWKTANREVFEDNLTEGNIQGAQAAIDDAKAYGIDTTDMQTALNTFINEDSMQ